MSIQERMRSMKDDAVKARLSSEVHRAERDRDRLEAENDALRARMSHAEDERSRLLDSVEAMSTRAATSAPRPKRHRLRRAIVLASAAGSAYVMGSKAGRARYDQLHRWWTETTAKVKDRAVEDPWEAKAPASVVPSGDVASGS